MARLCALMLFTLLLLFIKTSFTYTFLNNNFAQQSILEETSYFPARVETKRIPRLPGLNYTVVFVEAVFVGSYYVGVEELTRLTRVDYNLIVLNINGTIVYNKTIASTQRDAAFKPKYTLVTHGHSIVLVSDNLYVYIHGLNTPTPIIKQLDFKERTVQYFTIDRYIVLITETKIHCLFLDMVLTGDRQSSLNILNAYLYNNTLYLITYNENITYVNGRARGIYILYVESYRINPIMLKLDKELFTPLGYTNVLNKYIVGFFNNHLVIVRTIDKTITRLELSNPISVINETRVETQELVSGFIVNNHVVVIHGFNTTRYIDIYNENFTLIYRTLIPYITGLETTMNLDIQTGLDNKYFTIVLNVTGRIFLFLIIDFKYGLLGMFQYDARLTNETIISFKLINKGSLALLQTVNIYKKNVSNIYISTVDFKYMYKISDVFKIYCIYEKGDETLILYNKVNLLMLTRVTGVAVVIAIGTPAIITYTDYRNISNTIRLLSTPSILNIEATRLGIKCIPLLGYTGSPELYGYVDIVFENNKLYYLNTTEFSAILVLTGRPAVLVFRDYSTGLAFSIEHNGGRTIYYIPPSSYSVEVVQGAYTIAKIDLSLERARVFYLDIDEIIKNYASGENSFLQFLINNIVYILVGLIIALIALLVASIISIKRS